MALSATTMAFVSDLKAHLAAFLFTTIGSRERWKLVPYINDTAPSGAGFPHPSMRPPDLRSGDRDQKYGTSSDRLLLVGLILFSYGAWLLGARHAQTEDGAASGGLTSPLTTIIWAVVYVAAIARVFARRTEVVAFASSSTPLILILLLSCSSTLWSDQPGLTARRSIELGGTVTVALYFASRLSLLAFTEALALAITIAAAISVILATSLPSVGLDPDNSLAWSGLFEGRNFLGQTMVLGMVTRVCLAGHLRRCSRKRQVAELAIFALFLILLLGSGNGSGVGITIILALIIPILLISRAKKSRTLALFGVLGLAVAILAGSTSEGILGLLGKDTTLTGRTMLWQFAVDAISQRPALGYGYSAFWGRDAPAASLVYPYINWVPGTAHNGFLEVALNFGIVGEILFVWLLVLALSRAFALFWRGRGILSGWPLFAMLCVILNNFSEATLLMHAEVDWIVFVSAFVFATAAGRHPAYGSDRNRLRGYEATGSARG